MTSGGNTKSTVPGAIVPDGGWGWIIVLASFMIHFIMDGFKLISILKCTSIVLKGMPIYQCLTP